MRYMTLVAALLFPLVAAAQPAPQPAAPPSPAQAARDDMVLLPRAVVVGPLRLLEAIGTLHPELMTPSVDQVAGEVMACLGDNPTNGVTVHNGPDQCAPVTVALEAREKELKDAQAAASAAKKSADAPAAEAPANQP